MCLTKKSPHVIHPQRFDCLILWSVCLFFSSLLPSPSPLPNLHFSSLLLSISLPFTQHSPSGLYCYHTLLSSMTKSSLCSQTHFTSSSYFLPSFHASFSPFWPVPASPGDPGRGEGSDQCRACGAGRPSGDQRGRPHPSWPPSDLLQRMQGMDKWEKEEGGMEEGERGPLEGEMEEGERGPSEGGMEEGERAPLEVHWEVLLK